MFNVDICWENFVSSNNGAYGLQQRFEDLCRQLFACEFLTNDGERQYLHNNPNNPGIESDPIFDHNKQKWVGYQAKYFVDSPGYQQILSSAKAVVEHYSSKVDIVYLYCNKPLSVKAQDLQKAIEVLDKVGINLVLITDNAVLDLVRKNEYLGEYYFGMHGLTEAWFRKRLQSTLDMMGERYNSAFNVETRTAEVVSLFCHDEKAAHYLNQKKAQVIQQINSEWWTSGEHRSFLRKLRENVQGLPDVDIHSLQEACLWYERCKSSISSDIEQFVTLREEASAKLRELRNNMIAEQGTAKKIENQIDTCLAYDRLISMIEPLRVDENEALVLSQKIAVIFGNAGCGKTQILANEANYLSMSGTPSVLLSGGLFLDDQQIQKQIMDYLNPDYSFDQFLNLLEVIGSKNQKTIVILIDALNETWNLQLWKNALPGIFNIIRKLKYVRCVCSLRTEYKDYFSNLLSQDGIVHLFHYGFTENTMDAIRQFVNHFGIPFSPVQYFESRFTNPLFLSLYCKTYREGTFSLQVLYERLLENANAGLNHTMAKSLLHAGYQGDVNLVEEFVVEMAKAIISHGMKSIPRELLLSLPFWNQYGIAAAPFITNLTKEGIIHRYAIRSREFFLFAYDQMNDYYCAKYLAQTFSDWEEACAYIIENVLHIDSGDVDLSGTELFLNLMAILEEYYEVNVDSIFELIDDTWKRRSLAEEYVKSFMWCSDRSINIGRLLTFLGKYDINYAPLWEVFICNSIKEGHPMNADSLHQLLFGLQMNERDAIWTTYINQLSTNERILQLISDTFEKGNIVSVTREQCRLLLILFSWLLTSSNRYIRDITSKAMIELMKDHMEMCCMIWDTFVNVNDPYIIQRLCGVIWGCCCRSNNLTEEQYADIANRIYNHVFLQPIVKPDILLRDYARLIIEYYLHIFPDNMIHVDKNKIIPPYESAPIPYNEVFPNDSEYEDESFSIIHSMRFDGMGLSGDFGRYVFQRALSGFNVHDKERVVHDYAMYLIFHEMKYTKSMLGFFDSHITPYYVSPGEAEKIERIGKKYQWIAMYNIMARIADHERTVEGFGADKTYSTYCGAWNPYVRDFDPSQNFHFSIDMRAHRMPVLLDTIIEANRENKSAYHMQGFDSTEWLKEDCLFFRNQSKCLISNDESAVPWIALDLLSHTDSRELDADRLYDWCHISSFLVDAEQADALQQCDSRNLLTGHLLHPSDEYRVFCREYPWAPGCKEINESCTREFEVKTGESVVCQSSEHETTAWNALLKDIDPDLVDNEPKTWKRDVTKSLGTGIKTTVSLLWEEEYDASKGEVHSSSVPCFELINVLSLTPQLEDYVYYDQDGQLAAFEYKWSNGNFAMLMRKDLLDRYLEKTGKTLIWIVEGAREIHDQDRSIFKENCRTAIWRYMNNIVQDGEYSKSSIET